MRAEKEDRSGSASRVKNLQIKESQEKCTSRKKEEGKGAKVLNERSKPRQSLKRGPDVWTSRGRERRRRFRKKKRANRNGRSMQSRSRRHLVPLECKQTKLVGVSVFQ